jgi:uncharacterized membrane protein
MAWHDDVVAAVDRQAWLDRLGDWVVGLVRPLLTREDARPVVDALRGEWLGHPLHPAMTDVPVGCWTASFLLDLVGESRAAGLLTAVGSAAAVGAAASGFVDWTATEGRDRRLGVLHGTLNAGALTLQLCSLGARLRCRRVRAFSYSALGLSVVAASAWLGGELAFKEPVARVDLQA